MNLVTMAFKGNPTSLDLETILGLDSPNPKEIKQLKEVMNEKKCVTEELMLEL